MNLREKIADLQSDLLELQEYFEERSDINDDGGPNREMKHLEKINKLQEFVGYINSLPIG